MAPVPKPVEVKMREGNPGGRPLPAPLLISGRPLPHELDEPPDTLSHDGQVFWASIVPDLVDCGLVDRVDRWMLEDLALAWSRRVSASRVVAAKGPFTTGSTGQIVTAPWAKEEREWSAAFERKCQQYGLTAVARLRLGLAELHRRALSKELDDVLGDVVEGEVVEDYELPGVPGL